MPKPQRGFFRNKKNQHKSRSHTNTHSAHPPTSTAARSAGPTTFVEGVLQVKGKFGFVLSPDPALGDVMIQGQSLRMAMDGDTVRARVTSIPSAPRRAGEIVEVLKRSRETVVGNFKRMGNMTVVVPESNEEGFVRIVDMGKFSPRVNEVVVVRITQWPTRDKIAGGVLEEVLGDRDTPGVELQSVIRKYEWPQKFSAAAEKDAAAMGSEVPESALAGRELFFDKTVFTIDGADAKDFDDAVSLEPIHNGWRLGVHIADVAHYVKEKAPLDEEAYERGTSVYLSGSVLPMLPFPLSDGLCSLRPHVVRLTLSCIMDINQNGQVTDYRVVESAIRSDQRFTYDQVEVILNGENPPDLDPKVIADVREMGKVAKLLRSKRFGRGSLDFDFPEPYVVTDMKGRPIDIKRRERLEAHRLIEDFMLLANETVARYMSERPFLYRVHETPDPARIEKLKKSLDALGVSFPEGSIMRPSTLSQVLTQTEGKPVQPVVHLLILRSLKQAVYSPINKGHFGLASECYTHFTSPIRRYPDLIVHRLLKERLNNVVRNDYWKGILPEICTHTSQRERVAVEAEREFLDIQKTRLMQPHVGKEFTGVVTGVTNFGFFAQLDQFFVEGLVHVTSLNDYYEFNEARMTLSGRKTGKVFSIGTKVKVRLTSANVLKHQLDFELLSNASSPKPTNAAMGNKRVDRIPNKRRHY